MAKNEDQKPKAYNAPDDGKTFDMYHLFSRWDVILLVLFVLGLLAYVAVQIFFTAEVV